MDVSSQLRNFKDFLLLYNRITEHCFSHCTDNLFNRSISDTESSCVDKCVEKYARVNQRILGVYMEVQQVINDKRVKEMEEMQKKLEAAAAEAAKNSVDTTVSV